MKAQKKTVIKLAALAVLALGSAAGLAGCSGEPTATVGKTVVSGTADIGGAYNGRCSSAHRPRRR